MMRFLTYVGEDGPRLGLLDGTAVLDVQALHRRLLREEGRPIGAAVASDMISFIERGSVALARRLIASARALPAASRRALVRPLAKVRLLAPIPRPRKNIFCMGRNYAAHARETRAAVPEQPVWFTKPPTAVVGPLAPVIHHAATQTLDYEAELVAVIGRRGRDISRERALDYVFGYTVMNDITARDVQRERRQWFKGKAMDTFAPLGPWIVHRSAIPDPQRLAVRSRVNGEVRQDASTADMVFPVAALIADLSRGMTLEPGDLIATGTPEGVGMGFDPPKWLKAGDVVEVEVEAVGVLRNPIVAPAR
jgi:2-keto-4-pentenoate hydratase/2-oxohepta-3-ene-1,7-dioic acid hydratase in catechol pathway